jgi:hypothetical protein
MKLREYVSVKVGVVLGLSTRDVESNSFGFFWCELAESCDLVGNQ